MRRALLFTRPGFSGGTWNADHDDHGDHHGGDHGNHGGDDDEHADKEGPCKLVCRPEVCELLNDTMYDVSCEASGT